MQKAYFNKSAPFLELYKKIHKSAKKYLITTQNYSIIIWYLQYKNNLGAII